MSTQKILNVSVRLELDELADVLRNYLISKGLAPPNISNVGVEMLTRTDAILVRWNQTKTIDDPKPTVINTVSVSYTTLQGDPIDE